MYGYTTDADSTLSPVAVDQLERVISRIGQLDRMVTDLLDYSAADLDDVAATVVNVDQAFDNIVELADSRRLAIDVDSEVGTVVTTASPLTICIPT